MCKLEIINVIWQNNTQSCVQKMKLITSFHTTSNFYIKFNEIKSPTKIVQISMGNDQMQVKNFTEQNLNNTFYLYVIYHLWHYKENLAELHFILKYLSL